MWSSGDNPPLLAALFSHLDQGPPGLLQPTEGTSMPYVNKLAVLYVLGTLPVLAAPARNLPLTIPAAISACAPSRNVTTPSAHAAWVTASLQTTGKHCIRTALVISQ